MAVQVRKERHDFKPPEEVLMERLRFSDDAATAMLEFVASWRQLFVDVLQPSHLPRGWSVRHRIDVRRRGGGTGTAANAEAAG